MSITTMDQLLDALGNNSQRIRVDKQSFVNQLVGGFSSYWRVANIPGIAAIPGAAAICTSATPGSVGFNNPTPPAKTYLGIFRLNTRTIGDFEIHDRLAHMGGLSGTVTTIQAVNVDASDPALASRIGEPDYSDVQWYLEWYTNTGATNVSVTCYVTYDDDSTGTVGLSSIGASQAAGRMIPIRGSVAGRWIKSIQSVQLSGSTGSAGSFGVTATRLRSAICTPNANRGSFADWAQLGFPEIVNDSCLFFIVVNSATTAPEIRGGGKLVQG